VESQPGEGSTFTVLLPAAVGLTDIPETPTSRRGEVVSGPARLLVVDDEGAVRALVSRTLEAEGYEVIQAGNGREALEWLAHNRVDVVLADVIMPKLGGRELGQRLADDFPDVPVIWMSGYPRNTALDDSSAAGSPPFLQKPIPLDVLVRTVEDALGQRSIHAGASGEAVRALPGSH
jgi:DNA-binding NtrC family response regulator